MKGTQHDLRTCQAKLDFVPVNITQVAILRASQSPMLPMQKVHIMIKAIRNLLRPKVTVQTFKREATDYRRKVRDMADRLDIENGRKPKFSHKETPNA